MKKRVIVIEENNTAKVVELKQDAFTLKQIGEQKQVAIVKEIYKRRLYRQQKLQEMLDKDEEIDFGHNLMFTDQIILILWVVIFGLLYYLLFG